MKKQTHELTSSISEELLKKGIVMAGDITGPVSVVVPLSGGKDSQACLMLALKEHKPENVLALFCDTGFEHPITYAHVDRIVKETGVQHVKLSAGTVLDICAKYKMFPGNGNRHCTDELKLRPSKFFYGELSQHQGAFEVWLGMRSEESKEREARYRGTVSTDCYEPHDVMRKFPKRLGKLGVRFRLPVIDWSKSEIFELLNGNENQLYGFGFDRVGCFPCLAGGESHQMRAFYFDETGRKHYQIAEQISELSGRPVLKSKKYIGQGPGGALFDDSFSGCAICAI